jgi:hypothetical protein
MDGHNIKGNSSQLFAVSELPITPIRCVICYLYRLIIATTELLLNHFKPPHQFSASVNSTFES